MENTFKKLERKNVPTMIEQLFISIKEAKVSVVGFHESSLLPDRYHNHEYTYYRADDTCITTNFLNIRVFNDNNDPVDHTFKFDNDTYLILGENNKVLGVRFVFNYNKFIFHNTIMITEFHTPDVFPDCIYEDNEQSYTTYESRFSFANTDGVDAESLVCKMKNISPNVVVKVKEFTHRGTEYATMKNCELSYKPDYHDNLYIYPKYGNILTINIDLKEKNYHVKEIYNYILNKYVGYRFYFYDQDGAVTKVYDFLSQELLEKLK